MVYNFFMKLVIQIPCYNEQDSILEVLKSIPKKIDGIDEIEVFIIDDASNDKTCEIAWEYGVEVLRHKTHLGLAQAFKSGLKYALEKKADILVNIDGDNQYVTDDIKKIIAPIVEKRSDIVIGVRPINNIKSFSLFKKIMQKFGSFVVKIITKDDVKDAASGFRAFNREALLKLNVFNNFTYTIETIIQAKYKNLRIENIAIRTNIQQGRKSKLFKNNFDYIFKQAKNIIRFFIIYRPCRFFSIISGLFFMLGLILGFRFLYFYLIHDGAGHIQSLILCAIVLILSFVCFMLAIVGDLFAINRKILEEIQYEIRQNKYKK